MRSILLILTVYLAAVAETSLVDVVRVGHVTPDLLALVALTWLLLSTGPRAFLTAGAIGLLGDLLGPGRVGPGLAAMLLVGYAIVRLRARFALDRLPAQLLTIGIGTAAFAASQAMARWLLGEIDGSLSVYLTRAMGVGLYTAGLGLPVLMVVGWIREPHLARQKRLAEF